jgi:hypothetical protein
VLGNVLASGTVTGSSFVGIGSSLTALNAVNISAGTLAVARGGTGATSATQYGVIFANSTTAYSSTTTGTAGQTLVSNATSAPTFQTLTLENLPDASFKRAVLCATTANLTTSAAVSPTLTGPTGASATVFPAQDGVTIALNDRILVKNQTTAAQNGIYRLSTQGVAATTAWVLTRVADGDTTTEIAGAIVNIDSGTTLGGQLWTTNFKLAGSTVGTTAMNWYQVMDTSQTLAVANGGTGAATLTANKVLVGNGTGVVTQPTNLHWDNTNSRLGIRTSAPALSAMHVYGDYASGTYLLIEKGGVESWGSTMLYDNTRYIQCKGNAEQVKDFNVGPGGVGIGYAPPIYTTYGQHALYCNGNVGIGTTNPQASLHINGVFTSKLQPSASVGLTTGNPAIGTIKYNQINHGATWYSASTGLFTVPVSGIYIIGAYALDTGATLTQITFNINTTQIAEIRSSDGTSQIYHAVSGSTIVQASVGQTLHIALIRGAILGSSVTYCRAYFHMLC